MAIPNTRSLDPGSNHETTWHVTPLTHQFSPGPSIQVCTSFAMLVGWYPPKICEKARSSGGFCWSFKTWQQLDVSKNSGTPKSSILIGFSIINHPFWGTTIFGNTHMATNGATLVWLHMLRVCIAEAQVEWISWCSLSLFCVPPATKLPVDINLIQFEYRWFIWESWKKTGKAVTTCLIVLHIRSLLPTPSPCEHRFFLNDQRYVLLMKLRRLLTWHIALHVGVRRQSRGGRFTMNSAGSRA